MSLRSLAGWATCEIHPCARLRKACWNLGKLVQHPTTTNIRQLFQIFQIFHNEDVLPYVAYVALSFPSFPASLGLERPLRFLSLWRGFKSQFRHLERSHAACVAVRVDQMWENGVVLCTLAYSVLIF